MLLLRRLWGLLLAISRLHLWLWWLLLTLDTLEGRLCSLLLISLLLSLLQSKLLLVLLHQPILMGVLLQQLLLLGIEIGLVLLQILEHLQLLLVEIEVRQGGLLPAVLLLETLVRCCCCIVVSGELCLITLSVSLLELSLLGLGRLLLLTGAHFVRDGQIPRFLDRR